MESNPKPLDNAGITRESYLALFVILALVAGGLLAANVYQLNLKEGSKVVSESEFESLQRRVSLLENISGESGFPGEIDNLWPVDEIYQFSKSSIV